MTRSTLNSCVPHADKLGRSVYGTSEAAKEAQDATLRKMCSLMQQASKALRKQSLGRDALLPF